MTGLYNGYRNKLIKPEMKLLYLFISLVFISCSFPKDPKDSYAKAKQESLKVGIVNNPPYTTYHEGIASGTEVELIEKFAEKEGLKVEYRDGSESALIKKLENYEIHLLIGGFDKKTEWKKKAGLTSKYNDKNVFLIAKGENELLYRLETVLLKEKNHGS
jgi:polar amino acid transport system substrate-binding protein